MADLNNDGLDDVTGQPVLVPVSPKVNMTANPNMGKPPSQKVEVPPTNTDDDWVKTNVTHPDDLELYNAMTPGEKEFVKTLSNTPGTHEALQFIRATPEDRAKIMGSFKEADKEAYETRGQGVKVTGPISQPLSEETYSDTQTTEEEKAKLGNNKQTTTNTKVDWKSIKPKKIDKQKIDPSNRYKIKSILDAFNDGDLGYVIDENGNKVPSEDAKKTRDYMIIDAISKGLGSIGKSISNVGAAYTGGAVQDATPEQSLWGKRNEEMAKSAMESEKAGVSGSREQREYDTWAANQVAREYNNASLEQKKRMADVVEKYAENAPNDTVRLMYMDIASRMLSGDSLNEKDLAVSGIGELWSWLTEPLK